MTNRSSEQRETGAGLPGSGYIALCRFRYFVIWISSLIKNSNFVIRHSHTKVVDNLEYPSSFLPVWLQLDRAKLYL